MADTLKDKLQSSIRVAFAALAGLILKWLVDLGLPADTFGPLLQSVIDALAVLVGAGAWYFAERLLERLPGWWTRLLILKNPAIPPLEK